jgi:hypothetical protein
MESFLYEFLMLYHSHNKKSEMFLCIHHLNYMLAFKIRGKSSTPNVIHLRITEFLNITYHLKEHSFFFRKLMFASSGDKSGEVFIELNPLDIADLIYWTRSSFQNIIFFWNTRHWTESRKSVILSVIQCQNILKLSHSSQPECCIHRQTFKTIGSPSSEIVLRDR